MKEEINMAKVELNEKKQVKASAYLKRLNELETYQAALEKKKADAKAEIGVLHDQLKVLNIDYFTVIDEVAANAINTKRRVLKDRIADLELVMQMDIKNIVRDKLFKDAEFTLMMNQSQKEFLQFRGEVEAEIKELQKQIEELEDLWRSHKHLEAERHISVLRSNVSR